MIYFLVGISHLILYLSVIYRYRKPVLREKSEESSETKLFESLHNRPQLIIFICLILGTFAANNLVDIGYFSFQETFLQSLRSVSVSASEAAAIASISATSYSIGRGLSILVSMVLSAGNMLLLHYGLSLLAFTGLLWSTRSSLTMIRLNSVLIGYSLSAIMPSMFAYINTYSTVDDRRNAMFHLSLTVPSMLSQVLIGEFIEQRPALLIYLLLPIPVLSALFFGLVRFWLVRSTEAKDKTRKSELTK